MEAWRILGELVALLSAAMLLGILAGRFGQRPILGYLLAGFLASPQVTGFIRDPSHIRFLAELGVALLLFTIGLEFSWQRIGSLGRRVAWAGLLQFSLTWACGALFAFAAGLPPGSLLAAGGILALSSTAFVLRILEDRTETDSRHGRFVIGILLLQDILLIPLLVAQSVLAQGRSGAGGLLLFAIQAGKAALLVLAMYLIIRVALARALRAKGSYGEREVPIILSVIVCMGCAWASHLAGLSPVLGAFLAGLLLADQPVAHQIRANVTPLRAVFVTLFFTSIGMLTGIPHVSRLPLILLLAAGIIGAKALLGFVSIRLVRGPPRVGLLGGLAIAQIGEFSFVLAEDALQKGLMTPGGFEVVVSASVLTLASTPFLFTLGDRLARRFTARSGESEASTKVTHPSDVIVVGYGPAGREVVTALAAMGVEVAVIESNPRLAKTVTNAVGLVGDGSDLEILVHAGLTSARVLVVTIPDPGVARTVIGVVHSQVPNLPVIVRARYHRYAEPIRRLGSEMVVDEEVLVGKELAAAARRALE